jgi:hypothetical protein
MSACRRGCQTNFVALALYRSECQFRRLTPPHWLVKQDPGLILASASRQDRHVAELVDVSPCPGAAGYGVDVTVSRP